jgi:hypothetical protein
MLKFIAARRFNYIDATALGIVGGMIAGAEYLYAVAAIVVSSIISVTAETYSKRP